MFTIFDDFWVKRKATKLVLQGHRRITHDKAIAALVMSTLDICDDHFQIILL